jgi:lipoprotein-anchoring transpeptidase ErfK/SrfK
MNRVTVNRLFDLVLGIIAVILSANAASAANLSPSSMREGSVDSDLSRAAIVTDVQMRSAEPRGVPGGKPIVPEAATEQSSPPLGRLIDVSLSEQTLRLFEGREEVFRTPVATGIAGAETPTGTFAVQYRMDRARFKGTYPDGRRYDVADVPWILAFWDDYTIHAAPWRTQFGQVGSNGCVTMPLEAAKFVYEWAEVGTPISIHH